MRFVKITYQMLRSRAQYENDRVTFEVELDETDNLGDAIATTKALCEAAIRDKRVTQAGDRVTIQEQTVGERIDRW